MQTAVAVLVSGVVALFGVTSAVLGFIAEANQLTPDDIHVSGHDCVYPANPAHTLGICAIFLLVVAQIIASTAGGCCTCCQPPCGASNSTGRRRVVGVVASVLSWIAAAIAVFYYLVGAALNVLMTWRARSAGPDDDEQKCYMLRDGVFVRAAVLSLVATALGIVSCVLLRPPAAAKDALPEQAGQHVIGLPQWPAQGYEQEAYPYPAQGRGGQASADLKLAPPQGQEHAQV